MTRIEYNLLNLIGKFVIKRKKIDSSRIIRYIRRALLAYMYVRQSSAKFGRDRFQTH